MSFDQAAVITVVGVQLTLNGRRLPHSEDAPLLTRSRWNRALCRGRSKTVSEPERGAHAPGGIPGLEVKDHIKTILF